jgi:hypothetical protein
LALVTRGRTECGRGRLPAAVVGCGVGRIKQGADVCVRLVRLVHGILAFL